tara:strand:- start:627 stop:734 length:108 start_codon:yes stop_codon:yes gene_type:complete
MNSFIRIVFALAFVVVFGSLELIKESMLVSGIKID